MGLGLKKTINRVRIKINSFTYTLRKFLFGFENSNIFLQRIDKDSLIEILKKNKAQIGQNCDIESGLIFHNCTDYSNLKVGNNCHIGKNCFFDLRNKVDIGNNVVISMQCSFITHIDMSKSKLNIIYSSSSKPIIIEDNCYIGAKSTILMGVKLGEYSFVAAGAVVTKDVEPFTMVGGVPAKVIKKIQLDNI